MSNPYKGIPIFDELSRGNAAVWIADKLAELEASITAGNNAVAIQDYPLQQQPGDLTGTYWVATAVYPAYGCQLWVNGQRMTRVLDVDINLTSGNGNYSQDVWVNGVGTPVSRFRLGSAPVANNNNQIDVVLAVTSGTLNTPSTSPDGLPVASATRWGVVRIGPTLRVEPDGTINLQSVAGAGAGGTLAMPLLYGLGDVEVPDATNTQLALLVTGETQSFDTRQELALGTGLVASQLRLKLASKYLLEWCLVSDDVDVTGDISLNAVLQLNTPQSVRMTLNAPVTAGQSSAHVGYGMAIIDNRLVQSITLGTSLIITTASATTPGSVVLNASSFIKLTPIY